MEPRKGKHERGLNPRTGDQVAIKHDRISVTVNGPEVFSICMQGGRSCVGGVGMEFDIFDHNISQSAVEVHVNEGVFPAE